MTPLAKEKQDLFRLIETWDDTKIDEALRLIESNEALKTVAEERYMPLLNLVEQDTLVSLKTLPNDLQKSECLRKQWSPELEQQKVLASMPITEIDFAGIDVEIIPDWWCYLPLRALYSIYGESLERLPECIGNLTQLTYLRLGYHQLNRLPESIGNLTQLTHLILHGNQLDCLPESVANLTQLKELSLGDNKFTKVPDSIGNLTQLRCLSLGENHLTSLPESLGNLTQLTRLNFWRNELTSLPESLGNLTQLRWLSLGENHLTSLPESLGSLSLLKILRINDNQLTSIPEYIGNFTLLEELYIENNQLTDFPKSLVKLKKLKALKIENNPLKGFRKNKLQFMYHNRSQVKRFLTEYRRRRLLPKEKRELFRLIETWEAPNIEAALNLLKGDKALMTAAEQRYMPLLYIAEKKTIRGLKTLLKTLLKPKFLMKQWSPEPEQQKVLASMPITAIDLRKKNCEIIPDWWSYLPLERLNLSNNQIKTLPENISKLTKLRDLDLTNNPIEGFNPEEEHSYTTKDEVKKALENYFAIR